MSSRLKNISIFFATLGRAFSRKLVRETSLPPRNILFIQTAKLGDMVCTTPMFRALKHAFPECKLTVAGNRVNKDLLAHNQDVDGYIVLDSVDDNEQHFRNGGFNVAILAVPNFRLLAALVRAGIPTIITPRVVGGRSPYATTLYKLLSWFVTRKPHTFGSYAPREYLRLLEPLGIYTDDTRKHVAWSAIADEKVAEFIASIVQPYRFLVGITAGAGNKEKQWDPKNFARVADYLIEHYQAHIVVTGGPADRDETKQMLSAIAHREQVSDRSSITIDELKALIGKFDVFIGVNTGPMYIAEALDVPTVDLVGPVSEDDQPPRGAIHHIVLPPWRAKPIVFVMDTRSHDIQEAQRIARSTRVEDVIFAAEAALKDYECTTK